MCDKAQATAKRKIRNAYRQVQTHFPAHLPPILALTDSNRTPDPCELAECLPEGFGLVYRHFGAENRETMAHALAQIARQRGLILLIGNDPDLARTVGAAGVHWPEANIADARKWRSSFQLMTSATHSPRAILNASKAGIDACLVSTVFASNSPSAAPPMGELKFRQISETAPLPVYALGGVNPDNMGKVAKYAGIAAIEGLSGFGKI